MAGGYYDPFAASTAMLAAATPLPVTVGDGCSVLYPRESRDLGDLPGYVPPQTFPPGVPPSTVNPWGTSGVPSGYLTDQDDFLRFSILVTGGPKTVTFYGTVIRPNGEMHPFQQDVTGNSASVASTKIIQPGPGYVQGVGVTAVGGVGAATIYVLGEIGQMTSATTFTPRAQILSGQLTGIGVAASTSTGASGGGGGGGGGGGCCISTLTLENPDNGHQIDLFVPVAANTNVRLYSITCGGFTSATVADRHASLIFQDWASSLNPYAVTDPNGQAANNNPFYVFQPGVTTGTVVSGGAVLEHYINLGTTPWFSADWFMTLQWINGQSGDLFTTVSIWLETKTGS